MEEKYDSLEELYRKILPALTSKKREMQRLKMLGVDEKEIWNYFCKNVWKQKSSLTLGEMVQDIFQTDNFTIYTYWKEEDHAANSSK